MRTIRVETSAREQMLNITGDVQAAISADGVRDGVVLVYCPHTTAGVTINEAADPDVAQDIVFAMREIAPRHGDYQHREGNSDAHVKASLMGPSVMVPVSDGRLALGTWQGVFLCEFDGPRSRSVVLETVESGPEA